MNKKLEHLVSQDIKKLKNRKIIFVVCDPESPTTTPKCELMFDNEMSLYLDFEADFPAIHLLKKGESYLVEEIKGRIESKESEIKQLKGVIGIE